jgi:PAS domain S-box-containing protein
VLPRPDLRIAPLWLGLGVGLALVALLVPVLSVWRGAPQSSIPLFFLVPVLLAAAIGGRRAGALVSCAAFVVWDWYFVPPIYGLSLTDPRDLVALAVFLVVALLVGYLSGGARQREQLVHAVVRDAPIILMQLDRDGRITLEGRGLAALGTAPPALAGRSIFTLTPEQPEIAAHARRALAGEALTTTLERRGVVLETRWTPVRDAAGAVSGAISVATDITARHQAEEALRQSEQTFRTLIEAAPVGITLSDQHGRRVEVNDAFCALSGYAHDELIGREVGAIYDAVQREAMMAGLRTRIALGVDERQEYTLITKSGKRRTVLTSGTTVHTPEGQPRRLAFTMDITERRQMEEALRQANAGLEKASTAKSAFLATMSHELRTPLNGVLGLTSLLQQTPLHARQQEYAAGIQASGEALLALIGDVLDLSKIEAGQLTLEDAPLAVRPLVDGVLDTVTAQAREKGLSLIAVVTREVPALLRGDALRLRQVLLNLVGNAVKFTPRGAVVVRVRVAQETGTAGTLRFAVIDTGIGIAPEARGTLFDAFTQADSSTARRYGGTGLGLAICKRLVTMMGGRLGVASVAGRGSVFTFSVPLRRADAVGAAPLPPEARLAVRALLVGSPPVLRTALRDQLAQWG